MQWRFSSKKWFQQKKPPIICWRSFCWEIFLEKNVLFDIYFVGKALSGCLFLFLRVGDGVLLVPECLLL